MDLGKRRTLKVKKALDLGKDASPPDQVCCLRDSGQALADPFGC